jgi:hypothetical protein
MRVRTKAATRQLPADDQDKGFRPPLVLVIFADPQGYLSRSAAFAHRSTASRSRY